MLRNRNNKYPIAQSLARNCLKGANTNKFITF